MTGRHLLHFTLGPVQGFIADARRTRDLWAGSFLLSWLSGQAMAALVAAAGRAPDEVIIFPQLTDDDLFDAINEHRTKSKTARSPYIGSVPNRFKADVTGIAGDPGLICKDAIDLAWEKLEQAVWSQFIEPAVGHDQNTKAIWDRQVNGFWQMHWVTGAEPEGKADGAWLDLRKNWRDISVGDAAVEPGDLCRLMGRYQEISGFGRIGDSGKQDRFYKELRAQEYKYPSRRKLGYLNIGKTERLCAIALVKRLFPLLDDIHNVIGWRPGCDDVNIVNWPSVSYVAAVPWLEQVSKVLSGDERDSYVSCADKAFRESGIRGETETKLFGLPRSKFFKLDGHLLHEDGIRAWDLSDFEGKDDDEKKQNRRTLLKAHKTLRQALAEKLGSTESRSSEFYALLLMDGDSIGARIAGPDEPIIKTGLAIFTRNVKAYFDPASNPAKGALIYAGGDDVMALVPLDSAIEAARKLRGIYHDAFVEAISQNTSSEAKPESFTLSGAIVFAQYKIPLRAVLDKAHYYLDDIAKSKNGRDSLALAVMKPGGIAFDWVSSWSYDPIAMMEQVWRNRAEYSSSFLYNIRQRYAPLFADDRSDDEKEKEKEKLGDREVVPAFADQHFMHAVLVAEYKKQPGKDKLPAAEVEQRIAALMSIGKPLERTGDVARPIDHYSFDGALVARFLSQEGREQPRDENTQTE